MIWRPSGDFWRKKMQQKEFYYKTILLHGSDLSVPTWKIWTSRNIHKDLRTFIQYQYQNLVINFPTNANYIPTTRRHRWGIIFNIQSPAFLMRNYLSSAWRAQDKLDEGADTRGEQKKCLYYCILIIYIYTLILVCVCLYILLYSILFLRYV